MNRGVIALVGVAAATMVISSGAPCLAQSQANDDLARQGRFHQPPPPVPVQTPQIAAPVPPPNNNQAANIGGPRRRPWRELTDSLLDMMAPRTLLVGVIADDPQTTGFGNSDFVEPTVDPASGSLKQPEATSEPNSKE